MDGMNAKIGQNNKNKERMIWKHSIGKINKNKGRLAQFVGQLMSGRKKHIPLTKASTNNLESCTQRQNKESNQLRQDK